MKKKVTGSTRKAPGKLAAKDFGTLIAEVRGLIQSARRTAATTVNTLQVLTNFEIGRQAFRRVRSWVFQTQSGLHAPLLFGVCQPHSSNCAEGFCSIALWRKTAEAFCRIGFH